MCRLRVVASFVLLYCVLSYRRDETAICSANDTEADSNVKANNGSCWDRQSTLGKVRNKWANRLTVGSMQWEAKKAKIKNEISRFPAFN